METESEIAKEIKFLNSGGDAALAKMFGDLEPRLLRMISFRLDQRLLGRLDPVDVLQDSYIEIAKRVEEFKAQSDVNFFVWSRQLTWQTVLKANRHHLEVQKRDARREIKLDRASDSGSTAAAMTAVLAMSITSPSSKFAKEEMTRQLHSALEELDETDREVLALRHFEQLSNNEVAEILGLQKTAASNRYIRALGRLKQIMERFEKRDENHGQ